MRELAVALDGIILSKVKLLLYVYKLTFKVTFFQHWLPYLNIWAPSICCFFFNLNALIYIKWIDLKRLKSKFPKLFSLYYLVTIAKVYLS